MEQTKPNNTPAFPFMWDAAHRPIFEKEQGMTLRDYFAAKAMQGMMGVDHEDYIPIHCEQLANQAYMFADAMLKAREK